MISLIITIAILGLIVWIVTSVIPMPAPFPQIIIGAAAIFALIYILNAFGVGGGFGHLR